jgi:hypothetical protein
MTHPLSVAGLGMTTQALYHNPICFSKRKPPSVTGARRFLSSPKKEVVEVIADKQI